MRPAPGLRPGPRNALADVPGIRVGHATLTGPGELTGTTVVLGPPDGMCAGVDVRGGAPGTQETDLLDPTALVDRVDAVVLTGGSAYGLAAVSGVTAMLGELGRGLPVGAGPGEVVPIVPGAVVFDLGRGGRFGARPEAATGRAALADALAQPDGGAGVVCGTVGAGTGTLLARSLRGGVGQASVLLPGPPGFTVAALVVLNAAGLPFGANGALLGAPLLLPGDGPPPGVPSPAERQALERAVLVRGTHPAVAHPAAPTNTTLVVLATDAPLDKARCTKLAALGQAGMARAVNPAHTLLDGDAVFAVSTGTRQTARTEVLPGDVLHEVFAAGADVVTRAVVRAVLAARSVTTPAGTFPGYLDLAPSAAPAT